MLDAVRDTLDVVANSRGRPTSHLATGAALTAGAVLVSALIAARNAPTPAHPAVKRAYDALRQPSFKPPRKAFAIVWPPLFLLLTISGIRVWNAPDSPERTRALGLWGGIQVLNAVWMALGPRRLEMQVAAAAASLGVSVAYAREAAKVDPPAAGVIAPFLGWIGFANVLTGELCRLNRPQNVTLH